MTTQMRASAREMRHMVGRYLHARSCPAYAVNAIRDAIMAAQAEGADAVTEMERVRDRYAGARTSFDVRRDGDGIVLDGRGTPAILLAPALIDELSLAAVDGVARVHVVGTPGVGIAAALGEYAAVRGVAFEIEPPAGDDAAEDAEGDAGDRAILAPRRIERTPVRPAESAAGPAMRRILLEGYVMDADQFWRLFHESNEALTPDSELSRRHAGSQLYDENGDLIGEVSEETYLHLRRDENDPERAVLA
ncbi:hypothetical protein [Leucobacter chromiiresistens]|uniref:Uncharacterized protein n=1 Tax=Leucobacter chromiiresistens TaxID=1079994 RepID=A0A1H0YP24_9MICO|nr:hypothetical protein [Leucobacter chromiiresistens]SDQ16895.1 hypothetical protein SAMN04488565_1057 [Leucobacter chromiiresistens]